MAISPLKKVYIAGLRTDKDRILESLQKAGIIHVETDLKKEIEAETREKEILTQNIEFEISRAEHILEFLTPYEKKKNFFASLDQSINNITYKDLTESGSKADPDKLYNECYNLGQRLKEYTTEENELKSELSRLEPYLSLNVPMGEIKDSANVIVKTGVIEAALVNDFIVALEDTTIYHEIFKIEENIEKYDYFVVYYLKSEQEEME
jgi:V/A-type H+-transporting ATPase subunit I